MIKQFSKFLLRCIKFVAPYGIIKLIKQSRNKKVSYSYETKKILKKNIISVFAFYSNNGLIPDSDIYYIKQLNKFSNVIVIGDCLINKRQVNKIKKYIIYCKFERHKKYDFGSYFIGYSYAKRKKLFNYNSDLILANNSCIGPIFDLKKIIDNMKKKDLNFWGLNSSLDIRYHIQSYFYYFCYNAKMFEFLFIFLNKVKIQKTQSEVIKLYETKLTNYLMTKGFTCDSWVPLRVPYFDKISVSKGNGNKMICPIFLINNFKFPLVKRKIFINHYENYSNDNIKKLMKLILKFNKDLFTIINKEYPLIS